MTKDDAISSLTNALIDSATQLLVADRHRMPKDQARQPLTNKEAAEYVHEAGRLFLAASDLVKKHIP